MEVAQMSSTLDMLQSRSKSQLDFEFFLHLPQNKIQVLYFKRYEVMIKYISSPANNIQNIQITLRLNDFVKYKRCFKVNIMKLYISVLGHVRKLKVSIYIHLPFKNTMFQYRHA